jgi:hypothetical protein
MNTAALDPDELDELDEPDESDELDPEPADPEPADPEEPAEPPMSTTVPAGVTVVAVPRSATVPVAWMPVTSS